MKGGEAEREVPEESLQFYMHATFMAAVLEKLFTTRRKRKEKGVGGEEAGVGAGGGVVAGEEQQNKKHEKCRGCCVL